MGDLFQCEFRFSDDVCGGDVCFRVMFPSDYPFKPPKIAIDSDRCASAGRAIDRFRTVCPQFVCWQRDGSSLEFDLLRDHWSPALITWKLLTTVRKHMCMPSFPEAAATILELAPTVPAQLGDGTVTILLATAGEAPPKPSQATELFLLMDPQW